MGLDFKDKVVVVTGGAQGIGRKISEDFLERGAFLSILDIKEELLNQVKEISKEKIDVYRCDVSNYGEVEEVFDKIIDKKGKIDILVNNAGITKDGLLLRLKEEDWDKVIAVNLKSVYNCSKAVLKYMLKQREGKIVNISSIIGLWGNPGQTNYSASKAGILGFTKSLAREVGPRGINVNAVAPGYIETAMTERLPQEVKNKMLSQISLGRFGKPKDVSAAVLFLASGLADYITGKVIVVDGGLL